MKFDRDHRPAIRVDPCDELGDEYRSDLVGWVERSETHLCGAVQAMGFAALNPSYELSYGCRGGIGNSSPSCVE